MDETCRLIRYGCRMADGPGWIPNDPEVHAASFCREHAPVATLYKLQTWAVRDPWERENLIYRGRGICLSISLQIGGLSLRGMI